MEREYMQFDVVIVGGGPAGLSAAIKLAQLSQETKTSLSICLIDKGAEMGAHIISGALVETKALDELLPNWALDKDFDTQTVEHEDLCYLTKINQHFTIPEFLLPPSLTNKDSIILSLSALCRWLGTQAESLGVNVFPGFAADKLLYDQQGAVTGVITKAIGINKQGEQKVGFQPEMELRAKYTVLSEGSRGHLGKQVISQFDLDKDRQVQHYALGLKEVWQLPFQAKGYHAGRVLHTLGWPLSESQSHGGGFVYHMADNLISVGLIVDLNYHNPYLDPFKEFQRFKEHSLIQGLLKQGERIAFGARALTKGGLYSLPKQAFPGGILLGCDAGTLNPAKIKGVHCAIKSGILGAESLFEAVKKTSSTPDYQKHFRSSWLYEELVKTQNFVGAIHTLGPILGGAYTTLEQHLLALTSSKKPPWSLQDSKADYLTLKAKDLCPPIHYPKPDGVVSFDRASSLYLSGTRHEEDQPCHLQLKDANIPITTHLAFFDEPAQRYCPAGVYEVLTQHDKNVLQINAANCLHCKTCDIKDPSQNIHWVPPESGGGPGYRNT